MGIRVGFIVSHPFQYQFYAPIAEKLIDPVFVLEGRVKTPFTFSEEFLSQLNGTVVRLDTAELLALDGLVDVIFCMTPVHVLQFFKVSKVVALQYSMAKEIYQYGPWRIVADLNMMQGQYSHDKISGFCASEIVGNPRYDNCSSLQFGGGGILYMPTYGELSSLQQFVQALPTFPDDLQICVKLHHATEFDDQQFVQILKADARVRIIDGYANALADIARADVVVSDYSGAIFDALYLDRPIVLLQPAMTQTIVRTDEESIEVAQAHIIGPVVRDPGELYDAVQQAVERQDEWRASRAPLRSQIFSYEGRSAEKIIAVVSDLVEGHYNPAATKRELRNTYIKYIEENRRLRSAAKTPVKAKANVPQKKKKSSVFKRVTKTLFKPFKR